MEENSKNKETYVYSLEQCRREIVEMMNRIEDERFLKRVYIILMNHAKKRGN